MAIIRAPLVNISFVQNRKKSEEAKFIEHSINNPVLIQAFIQRILNGALFHPHFFDSYTVRAQTEWMNWSRFFCQHNLFNKKLIFNYTTWRVQLRSITVKMDSNLSEYRRSTISHSNVHQYDIIWSWRAIDSERVELCIKYIYPIRMSAWSVEKVTAINNLYLYNAKRLKAKKSIRKSDREH
jgi:hypothetical protein